MSKWRELEDGEVIKPFDQALGDCGRGTIEWGWVPSYMVNSAYLQDGAGWPSMMRRLVTMENFPSGPHGGLY